MEEKSVQILIPYERSFSLIFWEKEWSCDELPAIDVCDNVSEHGDDADEV